MSRRSSGTEASFMTSHATRRSSLTADPEPEETPSSAEDVTPVLSPVDSFNDYYSVDEDATSQRALYASSTGTMRGKDSAEKEGTMTFAKDGSPEAASVPTEPVEAQWAPLQSAKQLQRGTKVFSRMVTFMRPLRKSFSRSFNLGRRSTTTDVMTLQQFTEALSCRSVALPKRIYKVLRDRVDEITKETFVEAAQGKLDDSIRFAFDVYDLDADGELSREDYRAALQACLEENRVHVEPEIFEKAVDAFMDALDTEGIGAVQYTDFQEFVKGFLNGETAGRDARSSLILAVPDSSFTQMQRIFRSFRKWVAKIRFRILNNSQKYGLWTITVMLCAGCFYWRFSMYAYTDKQRLMSWSLPLAKAMGQVMKLCFAVILLPVSRNAVTRARNSWLASILPFDDAIQYHKFVGVLGFIAATVHTLCHVVDVLNWSDPDRRDLYHQAFPDSEQPSFWELCGSQVAVTGILLYSIMCIAYLFALDYPKRWNKLQGTRIGKALNDFNNFWYTHHLFGLFYVLLLIHPSPGIPGEATEWGVSDFYLWGGVPILVYVLERGLRVYRQGAWQTRVLYSEAIANDTVTIYLSKPRRFKSKAGMYIFLNCPAIAKFEWHPYTMTSAPQDDHIRVHIANLGDWSGAMCQKFRVPHVQGDEDGQSLGTSTRKSDMDSISPGHRASVFGTDLEEPFDSRSYLESSSMLGSTFLSLMPDSENARISLDGPYGAPSQEFDHFSTVMLIGAGIGITPFASVIRDILARFNEHRCMHCGKVSLRKSFQIKKVYFIWIVRDPHRALWFNQELYALKKDDVHDILDIQIFVTGVHPINDLRSKLLHMTQYLLFRESEIDLLTGARACGPTHFGRPDWPTIFDDVRLNHPKTTVGVFFCGQYVLSQILEKNCHKYSDKNGTRFEYMYERF